MEHTPISPPATPSESIPADCLLDTRHAAEALSGLPVANFGIARAVALLERFNTEQIGDAIEVLVALLDVADGDSDVERNGDELDGTAAEDDFYPHGNWLAHPGCPISDPGEEDDDPGGPATEDDPSGFSLGRLDDGPGCPFSDGDDGEDHPDDRIEHRRRIQRTRCLPRYREHLDWRTGQTRRELVRYQLYHVPIAPSRRSLLRRKRGVPRSPRA